MPHYPQCNHDFIDPRNDVDHWLDPLKLRASIVFPSCGRHFEVWACELSG